MNLSVKLIEYGEIDSTNEEAKRLARAAAGGGGGGLPELYGTVVTARRQSAGRGRRGRDFLSPGGDSVYASFILEPLGRTPGAGAQMITASAAVAVCLALEKTALCKPKIKWVNDVLLDGKKVCGILAESVKHAVILGIGVNINLKDGDLPEDLRGAAGSVSMDTETRGRFFDALSEEVFRCAAEADSADEAAQSRLIDEYRSRSMLTGCSVFVLRGESKTPAAAVGIADDGGLVVEYGDGRRETLRSGEVSVRLS
ncbi:MAG: biotin--[acetyl-CoA-carboxylase] ligase [Clostridiales Family XIII bacterium]|jgi:BirA family biotin operon repressor/biotin-[acetyl-CoA-carboxylase] ligase|nr:biotin--[acetyl-CoA-carboxylase] ligase [Clostridiales Family XIII bacterium]